MRNGVAKVGYKVAIEVSFSSNRLGISLRPSKGRLMSECLRIIILILACSTTVVRAQSIRQEVWLSPLAQEFNKNKWGAADFLEMFSEQRKWHSVALNVGVFKFYPTFIGSASEFRVAHSYLTT